METRYITKDEALECLGVASDILPSDYVLIEREIERKIEAIPAAAVVKKTEWDKLMFLVDAANQILEAAKWIPVKERLPEPRFSREWYLVALESGCVMTLAFERAENRWARTGSPVTHWMPLPEPPAEGGQ